MLTSELRRTIERRHRDALDRFRKTFMDDANLYSEHRPYKDTRPPSLGPLKSVSDRHAEISFGADRATLSYATENPGLEGFKLTLSMAGHHRMMGSRIALSVEETDAWLYAILGDEWADHSYHAGAMSGVSNRLTTIFYMLYLSEDLVPLPQQGAEPSHDLVPVRPEAFGNSTMEE